MKKLKALGVILLIFLTSATSLFFGCASNNIDVIYAEDASFEYGSLTARVGDVLSLEHNPFVVTPMIEINCIFTSSNPSIANVNVETCEITCLEVGSVIIYGQVRSGKDSFTGDSFVLTVLEDLVYATSFSLRTEEAFVIGLTQIDSKNEITYVGENINVFPTISYSNNNVVSYNHATGFITPLNEGSTTIFVTLELEDGSFLTKQFQVSVVELVMYIDAQDFYYKGLNTAFLITYSIKDNTEASGFADLQEVSATVIANASIITIVDVSYQSILVQTLNQAGTAVIEITAYADTTVKKQVGIIIS